MDQKKIEKIKEKMKRRKPPGKYRPRLSVMIYPTALEHAYEEKVLDIVRVFAHDLVKSLIRALPTLENEFKEEMGIRSDDHYRTDQFTKNLNRIVNGVLIKFGDQLSESRSSIRSTALDTAKWSDQQMKRVTKEALGIDLLASDRDVAAALDLWVRDNVRGIANLASGESKRIEQILVDGFRNGLRHEEVAKGILDVFKPSETRDTSQAKGVSFENRARFLARDQMGKLNAQITRTRQTRMGLSRYIWRTSQDERVRESHRRLEGRIFYWNPSDGDIPEEGHPGMPVNCRCWAEPVFDDLFVDE